MKAHGHDKVWCGMHAIAGIASGLDWPGRAELYDELSALLSDQAHQIVAMLDADR